MKNVLVIGGGFAGLAAAVHLVERGAKVTLLERRTTLGGRARSFSDAATGDIVDNGQHVFLGCYRNTIRFLQTIGALDRLAFQERLHLEFRHPGGTRSVLDCPPLPAPWHLALGLVGFRPLRLREKIAALRVGWEIWRKKVWGQVLTFDKRLWNWRFCQMSRLDPVGLLLETQSVGMRDLTASDWLTQLGQSPATRQALWNPMIIAALNESPDRAAASTFIQVLREAFGKDWRDSRIGLARAGLSQTYAEPAHEWLKAHGATVLLGSSVEAIETESGRVSAVVLTNVDRLRPEAVISAIPPRDLLAILPERLIQQNPTFQRLSLLRTSPIFSINLWLDRPIFDEPFVGLLGTNVHWIFNRSKVKRPIHWMGAPRSKENPMASSSLSPLTFDPSPSLYSCIISAAYEFLDHTNESLVDIALKELRDCFPEAREFNLVKNQVIREPHATLSSSPDVERLRPPCETSMENLFLAGDWVQTGLPATIESAVTSGYQAAEKIITLLTTSSKPTYGFTTSDGGRACDRRGS